MSDFEFIAEGEALKRCAKCGNFLGAELFSKDSKKETCDDCITPAKPEPAKPALIVPPHIKIERN